MAAKASWHRNYVTVTLCIQQEMLTGVDTTEKMPKKRKTSGQKNLMKDRIANCLPGVPWAQRPK